MYHKFSWCAYQIIVSKVAPSIIGQDQLMVNQTFSLLADTKAKEVHEGSPRNECPLSMTDQQVHATKYSSGHIFPKEII
jgi:hypothetical protein